MTGSDRLESRWYDVEGHRLRVRTSAGATPGRRPGIVLVHGLIVSGRYFMPLANRLDEHYDVYVPDLPGFGASSDPPTVLNVVEHARVLGALIDVLGIGPTVLLGNSMGCEISVALALRRPALVSHLILQGPVSDHDKDHPVWLIGRLLHDAFLENPLLVAIFVLDFLQAGVVRSWKTFLHLLGHRMGREAGLIETPTLIVHGECDPIVPHDWIYALDQIIPRSRQIEIKGAPHAVNFSAPDAFMRVIRAFLQHQWDGRH